MVSNNNNQEDCVKTCACSIAVLILTAASAFCQPAVLSCWADATQEIYLNGAKVHWPIDTPGGSPGLMDSVKTTVQLKSGKNWLSVYMKDDSWTSGFVASMNLTPFGVAETLITDTSWRMTDSVTGTGWKTDSVFDKSDWRGVGDWGPIADATGGDGMPCFTRGGLSVADMWYARAHWIWVPQKCFFRKTFTTTASLGNVMIRGNGFVYKIYLNGTLVGENAVPQVWGGSMVTYSGKALNANGQNVIAIEATNVDMFSGSWLKAGVQWGIGGSGRMTTDTTWKYSWDSVPGWTGTDYSDASWRYAGNHNGQYENSADLLGSAVAIWSTTGYFRKDFFVASVGARNVAQNAARLDRKVSAAEYFTLTGQRLGAASARSLPGMLVVRRQTADGSAAALKRAITGK